MNVKKKKKIGSTCGIVSVIVFISLTTISYLLYQGYDIFDQTLSKLGARPGSGLYFNAGLVITGFLFIPFYYSVHEWLPKENRSLMITRSLLGVAGAIALIGVGLVPDVSGLETAHNIIAFTFFLLTSLAILIVSNELNTQELIEPAYTWLGYACVGSALFYAIISIPFDVPILQKVTVAFYLAWVVVISFKVRSESSAGEI
ncbi:MAG: DUF998 domain-containing protein [Candidatus Hodarchaeales archaeon]